MSSTVKMTYEEVKRWFHYEPDTGVVTFTGVWHGKAGEVAGGVDKEGYREIHAGNKGGKAARIIWLWMTGKYPEPGMEMDHVNGNKLDNRWVNLRCVTSTENNRNRKMPTSNKSGIMGVRRIKDYANGSPKWSAYIKVDGKQINLYIGKDFFEACCRRKSAENKYGYHENHGRVGAVA